MPLKFLRSAFLKKTTIIANEGTLINSHENDAIKQKFLIYTHRSKQTIPTSQNFTLVIQLFSISVGVVGKFSNFSFFKSTAIE